MEARHAQPRQPFGRGSPRLASLLFNQDTYQLGLTVQLDVFQGSSELQLQCMFLCWSALAKPVRAGKPGRNPFSSICSAEHHVQGGVQSALAGS